jgi:ABC-2 type transport system permease protein
VLALYKKELASFLGSLTGYLVMMVFLFATGLLLWVFPGTEFNLIDNGVAAMDGLFILAPWLFLFLIPAVCMRMFSEEQKSGTIELLLTRPLSEFQLVVAKYFAALSLVVLTLLPTLVYYIAIRLLAAPAGNVDTAGITGSYLGLFLLSSGFVSIGVFASAQTHNQVIAFLLAVVLCFFFYSGFDAFSLLPMPAAIQNILAQLGISNHYASLSRGVIDSRDVLYFISLTVFFQLLSRFTLEKRKWK